MRWSELGHKHKSIILICSTLFVLFVTVLSPVKKTLQARKAGIAIQYKIAAASNAPERMSELQSQMKDWGQNITTDLSAETLQNKLFEEVGLAARQYNVRVINLESIGQKGDNGYVVKSFNADIMGGFKSLLQVLNKLEIELKYGKVASSQFYIKKKRGNKDEELFLSLLIQSVTKNTNGK